MICILEGEGGAALVLLVIYYYAGMSEVFIKIVADGAVIPVVLLGVWALLFRLPKRANRLEAYSRILMAGLTAYLVAKLIGAVYQPQLMRPFEMLGQTAGASYLNNPGFPSDHVLFCMAIALAVLFETHKKWIGYILIFLTLVVGIGRIAALVHTPLDVIGGLIIACSGAAWYLQKPFKAKRVPTEARQNGNHAVK